MHLLICADDLTGALDTAVAFSEVGIETRVMTQPDLPWPDTTVLVVNTESRHLPPEQAYQTVFAVARRALAYGARYAYKKTDSALRGNLGTELSALADAWEARQLCFVPAFPSQGRTTHLGVHYINGTPLAQSSFACDPFNRVTDSDIPTLLHQQTDLPVRLVETGAAIPISGEQREIVLFDAKTDADLIRVGQTIQQAGLIHVLAGCAGFGSLLPGLLDLPACAPVAVPAPQGPVLCAAGSLHQVSALQTEQAVAAGAKLCTLDPVRSMTDETYCLQMAEHLRSELKQGCSVIVQYDRNERALTAWEALLRQEGIDREQGRAKLAECIGKTVQLTLDAPCGTLCVFGGDTLSGVLCACHIQSVRPLEEYEPGVCLSTCDKPGFPPLVSKAGAFGSDGLLVKLITQGPKTKLPRSTLV